MNKEYWPAGKEIWVLFDQSNGDSETKRYMWWFDTRKAARDHKHWQNKVYKGAELKGPVKFKRQGR